ncbi:uncharacterized protein VP01_706g3 [Puccinia sorghi]|uniref:Uncharacterized protein n=1 Tax=Puccinia sorghi TaxID=27349 RepID=A0A0L6UFU4_9BASI|nr:uncharacterized protein VP01_706g3 [Puccinia sorghi]
MVLLHGKFGSQTSTLCPPSLTHLAIQYLANLLNNGKSFGNDLGAHQEPRSLQVWDKPGIFFAKIHKKLYSSREVLMSICELNKNLINQLFITLRKVKMVNSKKFLLVKYSWVENM